MGRLWGRPGVAERWARPRGTVIMRTKAWDKALGTKRRTWCLMMGAAIWEERVCPRKGREQVSLCDSEGVNGWMGGCVLLRVRADPAVS